MVASRGNVPHSFHPTLTLMGGPGPFSEGFVKMGIGDFCNFSLGLMEVMGVLFLR